MTSFIEVNQTRYRRGQPHGHYESFFVRANHPVQPLGFWIRYTLFSPAGAPERAIGERWAMFFDGMTGDHAAAKDELPLRQCMFDAGGFAIRIGSAWLDDRSLAGQAKGRDVLRWNLRYGSGHTPLFLLPRRLYDGPLPKAKALVGQPGARFDGELVVNGRRIDIRGWRGSQNHNWGSEHTARYAWGQVVGFDDAPDAFLEVATAKLRMGRRSTSLTPMVLRLEGEEHRLNGIGRALNSTGRYRPFAWDFCAEDRRVSIAGTISATREDFLALRYYDPPGGLKYCLNTKIANCELVVRRKDGDGSDRRVLTATRSSAFEILSPDPASVPVVA
ncbi:MAG: hypothetical protein AAGF12_26120 [Myxococcota bacterium]